MNLLNRLSLRLSLLLCLMTGAVAVQAADPLQPRMVLIIDDLGYNLKRGEASMALPGPVTYAILPFTPYAKRFADAVHNSGREVMLHVPMANLAARELGPGALTVDMSKDELERTLTEALASVPHVQGVNNHMGSLLTSKPEPMQWVMEMLKARDLFFVDSLTSVQTVAWKTARDNQIPYLKRHIFLDHERTETFIGQQFQRAVDIANKFGFVVVIGHPYDETSAYLTKALPQLEAQGVKLIPASELLSPVLRRQLSERAKERNRQAEMQMAALKTVTQEAKVSASSEQQTQTVTD